MRRWAVVGLGLATVVGCEAPAERPSASPAWVVPPPPAAWLGVPHAAIGRGQAPQLAVGEGLTGSVVASLRLPTLWQVPGGGPARAIAYGTLDGAHAIELIDIDSGRIVWRNTTVCAGPVVGVTAQTVVCADGKGTRALGLDGKQRWAQDGAGFVAMTDERVVLSSDGQPLVLDATDGDELARIKLPAGIAIDSIVASCGDAGRELFAYGQDGMLVRIAGPKIAWSVQVQTLVGIDACDDATVLVDASPTLLAVARDTGTITGRVDKLRSWWRARDGSPRVEVSTDDAVARWSRDLVQREPVALPPLGEVLASRGPLRLVRATRRTAVLLDDSGVRAYVPLAQMGAALGEQSIVAASWQGSPGESVRRLAIPDPYRRALRITPQQRPVTLPAELRDLPPATALDASTAVALPDVGEPTRVAFDGETLVVVGERSARFDLRAKTATAQACLAPTCVLRDKRGATLSGGTWHWATANIDNADAAGDIVVAYDADRATVLGRGGTVLATIASDDGAPVRAAALAINGMTMLVSAERNRVVGRLPAVQMTPAWSVDVHGVVASLIRAGDGVLVTLEDGDAYRLDARTGEVSPVAAIGLVWTNLGDVLAGIGPGGPVAPADWYAPAPVDAPAKKAKAKAKARPVAKAGAKAPDKADAEEEDNPPRLMTPLAPPSNLATSWQLTLYELTGALRVRNDYALGGSITPATSQGAGALVVLQSGPNLRDVLVVDPRTGDPVRRVQLPEEAVPGMVFSTVVDGKPIVGTLLANPVRVVLF